MARKLMNAVQYDSFGGGVASLKHVEIPVPALKKGEILIKMEAASLNSVDLKIQKGLMRPILIPRKLPFTPATDIAGEVVEVGTGVTKFKAGDKVVSYLGLSYYLSLNRLRCCTKGICTECFLQMKISNSTRPTQCPFCKTLNYAVEYRGVKTKEEKGIEQIEEQRVIEAKIRMRQQELQDEELRMLTRQEISSSSRSMLPGEVGYSTGEVDEEIVSYQIPLRQSLRPRQNSVAAE